VDLLETWANSEPRLRLMRRPHLGIIDALNAGLAECRAPPVARMDADDLAHPRRFELQLDYMLQNPELGAVGCLVDGFPEEDLREGFRSYIAWLNSLVADEEIKGERFVESPLAHPSVVFRKEIIREAGGYQEHGWPEDYDLWLRLAQAGVRFGKVPELLLSWRDHPTRLTRSDSRYSLKNFIRCKAHYLLLGPLAGRDAVFIWGAGMHGRRLSKHLLAGGAPVVAFIDIDPRKIGNTRRGKPILPAEALPAEWGRWRAPVLLAAVGSRGARGLIRDRLTDFGLVEGRDWWACA
jgi:glycosyltransferase involved in cell wall biosynthesis